MTTHRPWADSTRPQRVGSGWQQQRDNKRIMKKHAGICHVCDQPDANEVDHVIPLSRGGPDTDDNKRPIHARPCHENKTRAESTAGKKAKTPTTRARAAEPHPGMVTKGGGRPPQAQRPGPDWHSASDCASAGTSGLQAGQTGA